MAYPELILTAPFTFIANFHAQDLRHHARPTIVRFMAESRDQAENIVAILETATVGQYTSLSQRIGAHLAPNEAYPVGTRGTIKGYAIDAKDVPMKVEVRNWNMAVQLQDFVHLLMGTASQETSPLVAALSAAPQNPFTGSPITRVNYGLTTKPFSQ